MDQRRRELLIAMGLGGMAVLVPGGDVAALTTGLRRVLDDPAVAARLVEAGTARAAGFSMDRLAARYRDLYETLLARTPS